ncbi:P-type ATPase [Elasticomyces elasticus]|nr:P-type ATPase [Elasticomyces elasticus]
MAESKAAVLLGSGNKPFSKPAHALTFAAVLEELQTNDDTGITAADAKERLSTYGGNELGDGAGVQPAKILLRQIANAMTLVLIIAMAVSFGIGSYIEGGVISAVVVLNVVVGFWQEFKAAKTMDSLKSLSSPTASAVRASENTTVPTVEIVPGDIVELKTGDTVPADLRLLETVNFETDEALLTGESLPVRKDPALVLDDATGPGDRLNVAYSSSTVTKGRARGVVFATGLDTEIGTIAAALRATGSKVRTVKRNDEGQAGLHRYAQAWGLTATDAVGHFLGVNVGTPLQRKLSRLAVLLFCVAVVCAIIVLAANNFSSEQEVIIYAVATGLSMIPASLIVVLTITMAAGTKRMVERHVIVRNLKSLEALGAVTDICSDKTGTLTQGKMITKKAYIPASGTFSVEDAKEPFNPTNGHVTVIPNDHSDAEKAPTGPNFTSYDTSLARDDAHLGAFLDVAALANTSVVSPGQQEGEWHARGDSTEIAINVFACRFDWTKSRLVGGDHPLWKTKLEFPFDSDVKKMSVIVENTHTEEKHVLTKGAVERVLDSCADYHATSNDSMNATKMTDQQRQRILGKVEELASQGLRVLAFASRIAPPDLNYEADIDRNSVECELTFRGLIGLYDPPRAESASSVAACRRAGIEVHMLTGDHPGTARAIAIEVGILPSLVQLKGLAKDVADALVMTASGFDKLSDAEVDELPQLPLVVARCAPNTKVRMIEALHRRNKFTAMLRSRDNLLTIGNV